MKSVFRAFLAALISVSLCAAPTVSFAADRAKASVGASGTASWYGPGFHGRKTANGERYNMNEMTAAHKTLRFGTKVRVINQRNGKSVIVRINDRGPYVGSRVIDLSKSAAQKIDMIGSGTAKVKLQVL